MQSRVITINIRKYLVRQPRTKRARKASRYFRERIAHYTKTDPDNVKIDKELNSLIIKHYSRRMVPIKASVSIENGIARVSGYPTQQAQTQQSKANANSKLPQQPAGKQQKKEAVPSRQPQPAKSDKNKLTKSEGKADTAPKTNRPESQQG